MLSGTKIREKRLRKSQDEATEVRKRSSNHQTAIVWIGRGLCWSPPSRFQWCRQWSHPLKLAINSIGGSDWRLDVSRRDRSCLVEVGSLFYLAVSHTLHVWGGIRLDKIIDWFQDQCRMLYQIKGKYQIRPNTTHRWSLVPKSIHARSYEFVSLDGLVNPIPKFRFSLLFGTIFNLAQSNATKETYWPILSISVAYGQPTSFFCIFYFCNVSKSHLPEKFNDELQISSPSQQGGEIPASISRSILDRG